MEKITLAIVSIDEAYNNALALSLINVYKDFEINTYTSRDFLTRCTDYKGRGAYYDSFDIVLWAGLEIEDAYGGNIIYLTDKVSLIYKDYQRNKFSLYKYSSAHTIVGAIFEIYSHLTGRKSTLIKQDNIRLFGFASCGGGMGCTTIAMAVAQELSRFYDKKVFYISLEDVESTGDTMNTVPGSKSSAEYLYKLLSDRDKNKILIRDSCPFIESYIVNDEYGVEAFAPSDGKNPIRGINSDDTYSLIESLVDSGHYDVLIVDLASCLTESAISIMQLLEKICLVSRENLNRCREENYLSQIIYTGGEKTMDKFIKVNNMCEKGEIKYQEIFRDDDFAEEAMINTSLEIAKFHTKARMGNAISENAFSNDISKLTKQLIGENI